MKYALLVCHDEEAITRTDEQRVAAFNAFSARMGDRLLGYARLRPTSTATTVRVRGGDVVIADGPFAETKEQVAGFFIVECADLDEAVEAAASIPTAAYGAVEVRPLWEL